MSTECWDLFWQVPLTRFPSYPSAYYSLLLNYQDPQALSQVWTPASWRGSWWIEIYRLWNEVSLTWRSDFGLTPLRTLSLCFIWVALFSHPFAKLKMFNSSNRRHTVSMEWRRTSVMVCHSLLSRSNQILDFLNDAFYLKCYLVCACRVYTQLSGVIYLDITFDPSELLHSL